jgi:hypothetical protein
MVSVCLADKPHHQAARSKTTTTTTTTTERTERTEEAQRPGNQKKRNPPHPLPLFGFAKQVLQKRSFSGLRGVPFTSPSIS